MVIYYIENIITGKLYIGQTINKFKYRKNAHIKDLINNCHRNQYLQNSWNKYGKNKFRFKILESDFTNINDLNCNDNK